MEKRYRSHTIFVRSTSSEKNAIKERMKLSGYTDMSSYVRDMALSGRIININTKELKDVVYEVHKIGVNINQIAHHVNESQGIYKEDMEEIQVKMEEIWELLQKNLSDFCK